MEKVVIVIDDENRENEGDFIAAAEMATEIVNFMATYGKGLICTPLIEERCEELGLDLMIGKNTAALKLHSQFLLIYLGMDVQQVYLLLIDQKQLKH